MVEKWLMQLNLKANAMGLGLECPSLLHEGMLLPVLMFRNETMEWEI